MKIQLQILDILNKSRREMYLREICNKTKLTKTQVYNAILDLCNRNLVKKTKEDEKIASTHSGRPKIKIKVNTKSLERIGEVIERG